MRRAGTGWFALGLWAALVSGCAGTDGASGAAGTDGRTALVSTAAEPAGAHCAAGGVRVDAGVDADANGVLDTAEVTSTQFVCGGGTGPAGAAALVNVAAEPAGANCAQGGTRIDSGLDADADGVLDTGEVAATRYVCHGTDGASGQPGAPGAVALMTLTAEPPGAHCPNGGTRVDSGLDADADGALDTGEVAATAYVCTPDTSDPEIIAVDPAPGSISNGATFTVTFSKAVDPATVDATSFFLVIPDDGEGSGVQPVPATVTYDAPAHRATLVPVEPLWLDYSYELRVTSHVRDLAGNTLPAFVASYLVEEDRAAPRIQQLGPVDGGVVVPTPNVFVLFDEGLNWDSGMLARITLADSSGAPVPGSSWWDYWSGVGFAPDAPLAEGAYTASIDAIVADGSGNWAHVVKHWSFSVDLATMPLLTGSPVVSPTSQVPYGPVEMVIPVNAAARFAQVYLGDDWGNWYAPLETLGGNGNGEGRITGTVTVPDPPAAGTYSIGVVLYDGSWNLSSYYVASTASAVNYTTWDTVDGTPRDSAIPLSFLEVRGVGSADLAAAVEFVPGANGAGEVRYTISNVGTAGAGPFVAGVYLNPASPPSLYAVPDHWLDLQGLAAGATVGGTIPVSGLPMTETAVYLIADLTASISEPDEGNNFANVVYTWPPP